jgi:hypothetical protein
VQGKDLALRKVYIRRSVSLVRLKVLEVKDNSLE